MRIRSVPLAVWVVCVVLVLVWQPPGGAQPAPATEASSTAVRLGKALKDGLLMRGGTARRMLHFTFDDGPDPSTTPRLLDLLDEAGVKATFFFSASRFRSRARRNAGAVELAREVRRRGHTIGSHSLDHLRMSRLSAREVAAQLDESERQFERVFGMRTWLFRPPFGARSGTVDRMLAERGYTTVLWNLGLADWHRREPEAFVDTWRRVLARREREDGERGGIVLMHDTHDWSVEAFAHIHAEIMRRNCELLAQGEALYVVLDDLAPFFVARAAAPPGSEAPAPEVDEAWWARRQSEARARARARCDTAPAPVSPGTPQLPPR